jgi:hypothetical protein
MTTDEWAPFDRLPVGFDELRALYAALWERDVDPVTLDLCRVRLANLLSVPVDPGPAGDLVDDLAAWTSSPRITDAQRAALAFTEQYVLDVNGFTDSDADRVKAHFTLSQIATLTIAVATFDAMTRVRAMVAS